MNVMRGKNVLIAGGSGLIGSRLTELLAEKGYLVRILQRKKNAERSDDFLWDPSTRMIDPAAIPWADFIVNLAGSPVAGRRWSKNAKKDIMESRVKAIDLLSLTLSNQPHHVKAFIGASATGIYGDRGKELLSETSIPGNDFLAVVCARWEAAAAGIKKQKIRTVILRIGIVLSAKGGALKELLKPFRLMAAPYFGDGTQIYSWIHMDDLCRIIIWSLENESAENIYNAVAPVPVSNHELVRAIGMVKGRIFLSFSLSRSLLRILFGEGSRILFDSQLVTSAKILNAGFSFSYPEIKAALKSLL
jgi:uncharacterized protein (TIGR01777 family)